MVVAGIGGVRPALVAVVVGFAAGVIVFSRPFGSLPIDRPVDLVALVAFVVVGGAVGILVDDLTRLAADLAASRARVVAAADEARRQIERDLHDGAQQRLVSLGLELRAAQTAVPPELTELDGELSRIVQGLADVQDELREIALGIHPAILAEGGLGPALKTLARRSPVPVELDVRVNGRLPERVEVAAYYVVAETLTNAAKHAHASVVRVEVEETAARAPRLGHRRRRRRRRPGARLGPRRAEGPRRRARRHDRVSEPARRRHVGARRAPARAADGHPFEGRRRPGRAATVFATDDNWVVP